MTQLGYTYDYRVERDESNVIGELMLIIDWIIPHALVSGLMVNCSIKSTNVPALISVVCFKLTIIQFISENITLCN